MIAYKYFDTEEKILQNVVSKFSLDETINTAGSQLLIDVGVDLQDTDPTRLATLLIDESNNYIVDESGANLVVEEEYSFSGIPNLHDQVEAWLYDEYYPNGKKLFEGFLSKWQANFGKGTIQLTCLSKGIELDNIIVQIIPGTSVAENTIQDSSAIIYGTPTNGENTVGQVVTRGQVFQVASDITIDTIKIKAAASQGLQNIELEFFSGTPTGASAYIASAKCFFQGTSLTTASFVFSEPIELTALTDYYFYVNYAYGPIVRFPTSIDIGIDSTGSYSGQAYNYTFGTGWVAESHDLWFQVLSSGTTIGNTFNSYDPSEIVEEAVEALNGLGVQVTSDNSIEPTGTLVSYVFRFNTYYELLQKCVELSPQDTYFFISSNDSILYFKQKSSDKDHTLIFGNHIIDMDVTYSLENVKNLVYLSGGDVAGNNLLVYGSNSSSISDHGYWLETIQDNRVTNTETANIMIDSVLNEKSLPLFDIKIKVSNVKYDTTSLIVGQNINILNANSIITSLILQIQSISRGEDETIISLNKLPPTQSKRIEDIKRNLRRLETENNPGSI